MTSDTTPVADQRTPETTSDTTTSGDEHGTPGTHRQPGRHATQLPEELAAPFAQYIDEMSRPGGPLDADTIRAYLSRVRQFLAWLADAAVDGDPLDDPAARDWAVRDYRTWLLTVAKRKLSTVNAHLTALDDFYRRRGLGPAQAKRQDVPKAAPRALDERRTRRGLKTIAMLGEWLHGGDRRVGGCQSGSCRMCGVSRCRGSSRDQR
jgi:GNAT superfamily N-acetyltransferase